MQTFWIIGIYYNDGIYNIYTTDKAHFPPHCDICNVEFIMSSFAFDGDPVMLKTNGLKNEPNNFSHIFYDMCM